MIDPPVLSTPLPLESHIFLTNTALVLTVINRDGEIRMRAIAQQIGITERAVQRIVDHLITEGYLIVNKSGKRNTYQINRDQMLGFPFHDCRLSQLLQLCEKRD